MVGSHSYPQKIKNKRNPSYRVESQYLHILISFWCSHLLAPPFQLSLKLEFGKKSGIAYAEACLEFQ